ncbi:MAG: hypothetical protein HY748_14645 [Elusimicrobia bacterium]|nr:hypothetical protein [Elusimicrobiota bacterium]
MTSREFLNRVSNGKGDFLQEFLSLLEKEGVAYCAIGGLAVNAYAEPVVSLDLDVVIVADGLERLLRALRRRFAVTEHPNSMNVSTPSSDLRIQIQTDPRYQPFISRSRARKLLGYDMRVAAIEDVLQGKTWAAMDPSRRASKRHKDFADILRLVETRGGLISALPDSLKRELGL